MDVAEGVGLGRALDEAAREGCVQDGRGATDDILVEDDLVLCEADNECDEVLDATVEIQYMWFWKSVCLPEV